MTGFAAAFIPVTTAFRLDWRIHGLRKKLRVMITVSQGGHRLNDLLYRTSTNRLLREVTSFVSNYVNWKRCADHEGIPFYHLPITPETKLGQEAKLFAVVEEQQVDLIILVRYMQVLSGKLCRKLDGRVDLYMDGTIQIDPMITHVLTLDEINKGFDLMHAGKSIRSVVVL